jgi:RecB family exonuclease
MSTDDSGSAVVVGGQRQDADMAVRNADPPLDLAGLPPRLVACTPARLTAWLDCPRRYRMTYLDRPPPAKGPPWAHQTLGASVHAALAQWWQLPLAARTPQRAGALLAAGWTGDGFRDPEQSAAWRERARAMVQRYVAGLDPTDEPVGVERTVGTKTGVVALSGRVDRIDRRGGQLVVVDYKTGRHVLSTDDARGSLALAAYAVAAERSLRIRCRRVELHHLPSGVVVAWEHSDDSLARHVRRVEDIARELADATRRHAAGDDDEDTVFPPRPGAQCGWCDYARGCPEGRAVATPRMPWDGLPVERGRPEWADDA